MTSAIRMNNDNNCSKEYIHLGSFVYKGVGSSAYVHIKMEGKPPAPYMERRGFTLLTF